MDERWVAPCRCGRVVGARAPSLSLSLSPAAASAPKLRRARLKFASPSQRWVTLTPRGSAFRVRDSPRLGCSSAARCFLPSARVRRSGAAAQGRWRVGFTNQKQRTSSSAAPLPASALDASTPRRRKTPAPPLPQWARARTHYVQRLQLSRGRATTCCRRQRWQRTRTAAARIGELSHSHL